MSNPKIIASVTTKFDGDYHQEIMEVELLDINLNTKSVKVRYRADVFANGNMDIRTSVIGFGSVHSKLSIAVNGLDVLIVNPLPSEVI